MISQYAELPLLVAAGSQNSITYVGDVELWIRN